MNVIENKKEMIQFSVVNGKWCQTSNPSEKLDPIQLNNLSADIKKVECFSKQHRITDEKKILLFSIINSSEKQDRVINQILSMDNQQLHIIQKNLL